MKKKGFTGYGRRIQDGGPGIYCWATGKFTWRWSNAPGLNLLLEQDGGTTPVVYAKTLQEAGTFAEGFEAGYGSRPAPEVNGREA